MANLTPQKSFDDVYQIETTDPVLGGPGGIANRQPQQLANRDEWLKEQIEALQNDPVLSALATLIVDAADKMIYSTGENAFALSTITAFARALLDDANASAALTTLGVSGYIKTLLDDMNAEAARDTLGVDNALAGKVSKTGDEVIDGVKTFSNSPVVPDGDSNGEPVHYGQFDNSFSANGFQKMPSGMIIQWGSLSVSQNGDDYRLVTFPIAFPNAVFLVLAGIKGDQKDRTDTATAHSQSLTGFTLTTITSGTVNKDGIYIAIGH